MPLSPFPLNIKLFSRISSILNIYCFDILMWIPPPTEHLTASHAGPKILNLPFPSPFRTSRKLWKIVLLPYHSLPKTTCSWCPSEPLLFLFSVFSWLFLFFRFKKKKPRFYLMFSFPRAQSLPIHGFFNGADDSPAFMSRAHLHPHSPLPTRWLHSDVPKTHKEYEIPLSLTLTPQCSCSLCSLVHKRQSHLYSYLSQKLWAPSDP